MIRAANVPFSLASDGPGSRFTPSVTLTSAIASTTTAATFHIVGFLIRRILQLLAAGAIIAPCRT
jgi:hypothetical protein